MQYKSLHSPNLRLIAFWSIIGMLLILSPHSSSAMESPQLTIKTDVERAMAILKDPAYKGKDHFSQRLAKLEEVLLPQIDSWEFGRRCLGAHWEPLTDDQRREFIRLFKELVEKAYGGMLDRYTDGVQFSYEGERIDGEFAEVDMRIVRAEQTPPILMTYRLHQKDGQWLVYDVVAENVGLVHNYRTQFDHLLSHKSFEELTQTLERKIKELETPPAS